MRYGRAAGGGGGGQCCVHSLFVLVMISTGLFEDYIVILFYSFVLFILFIRLMTILFVLFGLLILPLSLFEPAVRLMDDDDRLGRW